jgi:hypothetical protein
MDCHESATRLRQPATAVPLPEKVPEKQCLSFTVAEGQENGYASRTTWSVNSYYEIILQFLYMKYTIFAFYNIVTIRLCPGQE